MEISVGQKIELEIDNEDLNFGFKKSIIVTWYQKGFPIYVELSMNKSLFLALKKYANGNKSHSSIVSVFRKGRTKYIVEPAIVVVNFQGNKKLTRED